MLRVFLILAVIMGFSGAHFSARAEATQQKQKSSQQVIKARILSVEWSEGQAWVRLELEGKRKMFSMNADIGAGAIEKIQSAAASQKELKLAVSTAGQLKTIEAILD